MLVMTASYCRFAAGQQVLSMGGDYFASPMYSVSLTIGEPVTETFSTQGIILTNGFQQPSDKLRISGLLTYDNNVSTGMANSTVSIHTLAGIEVAAAATNPGGYYSLNNVPNGTYRTEAQTTIPWGGSNAADAMEALKHFVGSTSLSGLRFTAANVDANTYINAADALLILKRFVQLIPSFNAGDWTFDKDTIIVEGSSLVHSFKGICIGDVNGSYIPNLRTSPYVYMMLDMQDKIAPSEFLHIQVKAEPTLEIGSMSLVLALPEWVKEIRHVTFPGQLNGNVKDIIYQFNKTGNELRLGAISLQGIRPLADGTLFYLEVTADQDLLYQVVAQQNDLTWMEAMEGSEFTDVDGDIYPDSRVSIPAFLSLDPSSASHYCKIYPNPAKQTVEVVFGLPLQAKVTLHIFNTMGSLIQQTSLGQVPDGDYSHQMDISGLMPGIYKFQLTVVSAEESYNLVHKMVIIR